VGYGGQQLQLAGALPWAATQDPAAAAALQQQALLAQQQQQRMAAGGGGAASGSQTPAGSRMSLPEGALAMGGGGMGGHAGAAAPEGSALSGVSTLGQPPPAAQHPAAAAQQQHRATPMLQAQHVQQRRSLDSVAQPPVVLGGGRVPDSLLAHHQRGAVAATLHPHRGPGPGMGPGSHLAANFLHRPDAAAAYGSPFGPGGGAPVVQLPNGGDVGGAGGIAAGPSISALSVPSINVDMMPPLGAGALGGGTSGTSGTGNGLDDDQVGFLDSSVLELLLTE
jgi:hypothetical protein